MLLSRRNLLLVGVSGVAVTLAGCPSVIPQSESQGVKDVQLFSAVAAAVLNAAQGVAGAPSDLLAKLQTEVGIIEANAALIAQAVVPQTSWLAALNDAAKLFGLAATPFIPPAPLIADAVQVGLSLLPAILSFFGFKVPPTAIAAPAPRYTPAEARAKAEAIAQKGTL